ncbi:14505_t:CDS:1 [Racocetra fulgida]|uniref:14505_t:CDS:1 n=1 Tax=Racocetra fulgida TaxID=60492 RepID=A0A9N8YX23_9GLOM|nr:14505_t:CDS:1 [Racocetra fulgida]
MKTEEEAVKYFEMLARVIPRTDGKDREELVKKCLIYTADKIRQHDPYFFKYYIFKNEDQLFEELLHEAENAIKVSEITNDDSAIDLINKIIRVEYDSIKTPITIKEALNCLKLRDRAFFTQEIREINDYDCSNYNGTEFAIKRNDNSKNYIQLKNFNIIQNVVKWLNFEFENRKTPHFEPSTLESIRVGIGIKVCLKDFRLLNGLKVKIRDFIDHRNNNYDIILFQFSNFLFYYLKNIFEYAIEKQIKSGYDIDFDHSKTDDATNIKWVGYACRDKYPKDTNHSRKRPVLINEDGVYSITNNYAFKFDSDHIKDINEKKILIITDANYPFISDFKAFKFGVLFYDFKNPFDLFLNHVMDKLNKSE